jgi:hypothetical protein
MTTTVAVLASTTKGGSGTHVETVASTGNQDVGRDLGEFYRQFDINAGDQFDIALVD